MHPDAVADTVMAPNTCPLCAEREEVQAAHTDVKGLHVLPEPLHSEGDPDDGPDELEPAADS